MNFWIENIIFLVYLIRKRNLCGLEFVLGWRMWEEQGDLRGLDPSLQREGNDEHIVGSRPSAKKGANCATTIFIVPSVYVVIVQFRGVSVFRSTTVVIKLSELGKSNVDKYCGRCGHF